MLRGSDTRFMLSALYLRQPAPSSGEGRAHRLNGPNATWPRKPPPQSDRWLNPPRWTKEPKSSNSRLGRRPWARYVDRQPPCVLSPLLSPPLVGTLPLAPHRSQRRRIRRKPQKANPHEPLQPAPPGSATPTKSLTPPSSPPTVGLRLSPTKTSSPASSNSVVPAAADG